MKGGGMVWAFRDVGQLTKDKRLIVSKNSIFFIVLIFYAANREAVSSLAVGHVGKAGADAEIARIGDINRTAPIVAECTDIEERTISAVAVARHGQFKRWGKSAYACVNTPT